MKSLKRHLAILLLLIVFGCQTEDFKTEISPEAKTTQVNFFSAKDIPQVLERIQSPLGIEKTTGAANQSKSSIGIIRMDEIMQVIDTLGNDNYTFSVDDQDNNHLTFSNLIVPMGVNDHRAPYLMKYEMDSSYFLHYVKHGFSIQTFKGTITRQYLNGDNSNRNGAANLEGKSLSNNDCDGGTGFDGPGGNNDPGGTSGTEPYYNWDPAPPIFTSGGQCSWQTVYPPCPVEKRGGKEYSAKPHTAEECGDHVGTPNGVILLIDCSQADNLGTANNGNCDNVGGDQIGLIPDLSEPVQFLSSLISLNYSQISWLQNNPAAAFDLQQLILEDGELDENGFLTPETIAATTLYIDLSRSNSITALNSTAYNQALQNNLSIFPSFLPVMSPQIAAAHYAHYAMLKEEYPNWSKTRLHWFAFKDIFHTGLDVMGLVPGFGEVFDLANAGVYAVSGDWTNAGLSLVATIPFVGWTTITAKWAKRVYSLSNGNKVFLTMYKTTGDIVKFSYRGQLRKVLNITSRSQRAHHIIPWRFNEHPVIQAAAKSAKGWHPNDILNGAAVAKARHAGSHGRYDAYVESQLESIRLQFLGNLDSPQVYEKVKELAESLKLIIDNNSTTLINDLF